MSGGHSTSSSAADLRGISPSRFSGFSCRRICSPISPHDRMGRSNLIRSDFDPRWEWRTGQNKNANVILLKYLYNVQAPALEYFRQSLVPIRGSRAGSLLVLDVSLPPITRRQRESPGYLAIDLVADDKLQLADGRPMLAL